MQPRMSYITTALMDDGSEPEFLLGHDYEIDCAFEVDGEIHINVNNEKNSLHNFNIKDKWFTQSFEIHGDLQSIWEEV